MVSISQNIKTNRFTIKLKKIGEYIYRAAKHNPHRVYFPYKAGLIHPAFDEIKSRAPIEYSNKRDANLLHLVTSGSKNDFQRNHVIEIVDHVFSIIVSCEVFSREPIEYYLRQEKIKDLYLSDKLKKIIFISNGQRELLKHYFPQKDILDKSVVLPLPWKDNIAFGKKKRANHLNFLFIASNYQTKGVEICLKAWEKFKTTDITNARLTLVSHDISKEVTKNLHKDINLIKKIPLSSDFKNELYKNSDVVIAFTLTDGITAIEATSYGKPVIIFRTQHSKDFIDNDNGVELDVPINVYDVDKYGIAWKTKKEFDDIAKEYLFNGYFDGTIDELANTFSRYSKDRDFLESSTQNAVKKYYKDHTIENRNKKLLEIYDECI